VHASSDGVAVISHDPSLTRLTGSDSSVSQLTYAELRRIPLGPGATFTSLADALSEFPEARFNIDLKSADAVLPTADAIRAARATDRVLVTSFSNARRTAVLREIPDVATSASAAPFLKALLGGKLRSAAAVRRALAGTVAIQVPERTLGVAVTTERFIRQVHAAGAEVHVWTINDAATMRLLLGRGVDGIITDRTDVAMQVLRAGL
jgi:glycerophosphoryl diester phosphodiesterase